MFMVDGTINLIIIIIIIIIIIWLQEYLEAISYKSTGQNIYALILMLSVNYSFFLKSIQQNYTIMA